LGKEIFMKKLLLVLLAIVGLSTLQAQAHTDLTMSSPANDAVVTVAPEEIVLRFSAAVKLIALSIREDGGAEQALEDLSLEPSQRFVVDLPDLPPGDYFVTWRGVGPDSHISSGGFRFTIADA
jgi:methionine-rich copper-binding protein CopC